MSEIVNSVVDPKQPWKLPQFKWEWPPYQYKKSPREWKKLLERAENGDSEAELEVSSVYSDGCKDRRGKIVGRRSARKEEEWLRRAAGHGNAYAQWALGNLLTSPQASVSSRREGLLWSMRAYRSAEVGGTGKGTIAGNIAITHRQDGNLRAAVRWLRRSVELQDAERNIELGIHLYWGLGIRSDPAAAVLCFRKAARARWVSESGRDDANFYLAVTYLEGKGVRQSLPKAKALLQRANRDNDHLAARRLLRRLEKAFA